MKFGKNHILTDSPNPWKFREIYAVFEKLECYHMSNGLTFWNIQ